MRCVKQFSELCAKPLFEPSMSLLKNLSKELSDELSGELLMSFPRSFHRSFELRVSGGLLLVAEGGQRYWSG